jgi:hypothetical protein
MASPPGCSSALPKRRRAPVPTDDREAGPTITSIVSGGQTGADRAALDVAQARGIPSGGWVPAGRHAEDGHIPDRYAGLRETESADPAVRTRRNVRDSDGTLILAHRPLTGGSLLTLDTARGMGRPVLHIDLSAVTVDGAADAAAAWISAHGIQRLNVAGPRASSDPQIHGATLRVLDGVLDRLQAERQRDGGD